MTLSNKDLVEFRFTIGSINDEVLSLWEPEAPEYKERLQCLKYVHEQGFKTSVSCEPMLDGNIDAVIEAVSPYTSGTIWIGTMREASKRLKINGHGDAATLAKLKELERCWDDNAILALYNKHKSNPKIRWKDSIRDVLAKYKIELPKAA